MDVTIGGRAYTLSETLQSDALAPIFADAWTASRVWYASQFLSEHLVAFASTKDHSFDVTNGRAAVIELGSGCGLAGLVAASLGADVVLTDQREAVELLQRNARENMKSDAERQRVHVAEYQWGTPPAAAHLPHTAFDYILVSDCINPIYGVESWRNLARSIEMLSTDATVTYLAHEARGDDSAMDDFRAFSAPFLTCERIAHDAAQRLTSNQRRQQRKGSSISLPDLHAASSTSLIIPTEPGGLSSHDSTLSLLHVLQTLWQSIAKDTQTFVQQIADGKETAVADAKHLDAPYYGDGVFHEDKPYFLRERKAELQRETARQQTVAYRELHCAPEDRQRYHFDRRKRRADAKSTARKPTRRDEKDAVEKRLMDRHDHKIQHLLHVLQAEMSSETQREIRALTYWSPHKPLSRQSKRHVGNIIKERYEAADRIMRILEDYHIVIGVDAAKYLEATIAQGAALQRPA